MKKGFSLIELLVVISIITLISSVLFSAMNSSREQAEIASVEKLSDSYLKLNGQCIKNYFKFQTNTEFSDVLNNGSATLYNGPIVSNGELSTAEFNGVDQYIILDTIDGIKRVGIVIKIDSSQGGGWRYIMDGRLGFSTGYLTNNTFGGWIDVKANGQPINNYGEIPKDEWIYLEATSPNPFIDDLNLLSRFSNSETLRAELYSTMIYEC